MIRFSQCLFAGLVLSKYCLLSASAKEDVPPILKAAAAEETSGLKSVLETNPEAWKIKDTSGNQALHLAAWNARIENVKLLLEAGADIHVKGFLDWTPLHYAAKSGSGETCLLLLKRGARLDALNDLSRTPLQEASGGAATAIRNYTPKVAGAEEVFQAIKAGKLKKVKALLSAKPKILKAKDDGGRSALLVAAMNNQLGIMKLLLEKGADVKAKDRLGNTALYFACSAVNAEAVQLLFDYNIQSGFEGELSQFLVFVVMGVAPEAVDEGIKAVQEFSTVFKASLGVSNPKESAQFLKQIRDVTQRIDALPRANEDCLAISKLLLEHGAKTTDANGSQALGLVTVANPSSEMLKLLLEHGAKATTSDPKIISPLYGATMTRRMEFIQLLLEAGADPLQKSTTASSALDLACSMGDIKIVRQLLSAVKDDSQLSNAYEPIYRAAQRGNLDIVRLLLKSGISVNARSSLEATPLHSVAKADDPELLQILLEAGAEINAQDQAGYTPLFNALEAGKFQHLPILFKHGASLDLTTAEGVTALMIAASWGDPETMKTLHQAGAKLDVSSDNKGTALHFAAVQGHLKAVKYLLDAGLAVDTPARGNMDSPLHLASGGVAGTRKRHADSFADLAGNKMFHDRPWPNGDQAAYTKTVELLISAGADVNNQNSIGKTPLHLTAQFGQLDNAKLLLSKGAAINQLSKAGRTPLHFAAEGKSIEMISFLLDQGAEINTVAQNLPSKSTPLARAVQLGRVENINLLLKHGADLHATFLGQKATLLHYAVQAQQLEAVKTLIEAGIKVDALDDNHVTPLMICMLTENREILSFLIEKGADVHARSKQGIGAIKFAIANNKFSLIPVIKAHGAKE